MHSERKVMISVSTLAVRFEKGLMRAAPDDELGDAQARVMNE